MLQFSHDVVEHRLPRCPQCQTPVRWDRNRHRPFCSLECRLIDLGLWLDERYRVEGEPASFGQALDDPVGQQYE